jgi:MinD-like ATPase involved in chromosome partitioning or flagellar assembly
VLLAKSNALVLLADASTNGVINAAHTIDWLRSHGFEGLLARTVVVVNETTADTRLDPEALTSMLARQELTVHRIPFDPHLSEGTAVDLAKLQKPTREAFEDLAATLADDFASPQPPAHVGAAH